MTDKFTESMEVAEVGDLRPSSIGERDDVMRGVLINGVTSDAAKMLYKKCEILAAGTAKEIEKLKEINADLLDAATHCCLLACECDGWCHSMLSPVKEGKCDLLEREGCYIWDAIQKARECQIS